MFVQLVGSCLQDIQQAQQYLIMMSEKLYIMLFKSWISNGLRNMFYLNRITKNVYKMSRSLKQNVQWVVQNVLWSLKRILITLHNMFFLNMIANELYNMFLQLEQDVHRVVHHVVKACTGYLKSCTTCSINLKFMFKVLYNMLCLEKMCTNLYNMFLKFWNDVQRVVQHVLKFKLDIERVVQNVLKRFLRILNSCSEMVDKSSTEQYNMFW